MKSQQNGSSKHTKPYVVGVLSPASAGATFMASNVAATMALEGSRTALIDFDAHRTLHHWLGRTANDSFHYLFERQEIAEEETSIRNLDAFTSLRASFWGDLAWMETVDKLTYDVVVLDFSSGNAWGRDVLRAALHRCDEVLFVADMDYARTVRARGLFEELVQENVPISFVMNKWDEEAKPCDDLELLPATYRLPYLPDIYRAIVLGKPLVTLLPELRSSFRLKQNRSIVQGGYKFEHHRL